MRIIMLGTGDFALPTFLRLGQSGHDLAALITQPDRPRGRKLTLAASPIKQAALERGIRVEQPEDVNAPAGLEMVKGFAPDLLVTAAYGQILSAELLAIPTLGGINLHGSILPSYRGASPVARAIAMGETETGVTVIRMTPRIDAGGMIAVARTPIDPNETAGDLEARLAELGAPLVVETIAALASGTASVIPQDKALVSKAPKLRKDDGRIDWSMSARRIHDHVRAMRPWPVASTVWHPRRPGKGPLRLIVLETRPVDGQGEPGAVIEASPDRLVVAAGSGAIALLTVQVPGKTPMPSADFLRGRPVEVGDRMGE